MVISMYNDTLVDPDVYYDSDVIFGTLADDFILKALFDWCLYHRNSNQESLQIIGQFGSGIGKVITTFWISDGPEDMPEHTSEVISFY
jgi:hypothetical protein